MPSQSLLAVLANLVPFVGLWSSQVPTYSGRWVWPVVVVTAILALVATLAAAREGAVARTAA